MKGQQLRVALYEESMLWWSAPEITTFTAKRDLPLHTTCVGQYSGNYRCDEPQKLRHVLFCQQIFKSAIRPDAFPRLDMGELHPASKHMLASLKIVHYNVKWQ